jgi:hypothetical protein
MCYEASRLPLRHVHKNGHATSSGIRDVCAQRRRIETALGGTSNDLVVQRLRCRPA